MIFAAANQEWTQTLGTGPLLGIAAAAIALILFAVIKLKLHAFLTLIVVSLITALATGIPANQIVPTLVSGFGSTLGNVALLVALGAMLGKLVEVSGGAKVLADAMIKLFGESRAPFALGVASLLMGFPIFFDAGLIVMLPVVFAVGRRLGGSIVLYVIPVAAAFSVMHVFLPPHPGPVAAASFYGAEVGLVMLVGLVVALPTWYLSGQLWGRFIGQRVHVDVPSLFGTVDDDELPENAPSVGTVISLLLLPVILIFFNTGLNTFAMPEDKETAPAILQYLTMIGQTPVALTISVLVAAIVLGRRIAGDRSVLEKTLDSALGPVSSVILITGAGGMFGSVLRASGIGDALAGSMESLGIPLILAAFLVAAVLRLAQGSATVALTTAAGLLAPAVIAANPSGMALACLTLATAAGSVIGSHVNDSGFWLVGRLTGMDVKQTLKTWTVQQTIEAVVAFLIVVVIYQFV